MVTSISGLKFRKATSKLHKRAKKETPVHDAGAFGTFQLAGCTWEIRTSPDINDYGYTANTTHTIMIKEDLTPQSAEITLWHEALHAMFFTMGNASDHDEEFIDGLAHLLMQFTATLDVYGDKESK